MQNNPPPEIIDINAVARDDGYAPQAGLGYEVATGTVLVMRVPTEAVIEAYDAVTAAWQAQVNDYTERFSAYTKALKAWGERRKSSADAASADAGEAPPDEAMPEPPAEPGDVYRELTIPAAEVVLSRQGGAPANLQGFGKNLIPPVLGRAVDDFFVLKQPKIASHMKDFLAVVQAAGSGQATATTNRRGDSPDGPTAGASAAKASSP